MFLTYNFSRKTNSNVDTRKFIGFARKFVILKKVSTQNPTSVTLANRPRLAKGLRGNVLTSTYDGVHFVTLSPRRSIGLAVNRNYDGNWSERSIHMSCIERNKCRFVPRISKTRFQKCSRTIPHCLTW